MSSNDPRVGTYLAEYRIESLIGAGGMGIVYLAEHTHLGKKVALKVLPPQYAQDIAFRERFDREARLAASLDHPNIVPVFDAGEADGQLWIAMRYVAGSDLGGIGMSPVQLNFDQLLLLEDQPPWHGKDILYHLRGAQLRHSREQRGPLLGSGLLGPERNRKHSGSPHAEPQLHPVRERGAPPDGPELRTGVD